MRWKMIAADLASGDYNASSASIVSTRHEHYACAISSNGCRWRQGCPDGQFDPTLFLQLAQEHRATQLLTLLSD